MILILLDELCDADTCFLFPLFVYHPNYISLEDSPAQVKKNDNKNNKTLSEHSLKRQYRIKIAHCHSVGQQRTDIKLQGIVIIAIC